MVHAVYFSASRHVWESIALWPILCPYRVVSPVDAYSLARSPLEVHSAAYPQTRWFLLTTTLRPALDCGRATILVPNSEYSFLARGIEVAWVASAAMSYSSSPSHVHPGIIAFSVQASSLVVNKRTSQLVYELREATPQICKAPLLPVLTWLVSSRP